MKYCLKVALKIVQVKYCLKVALKIVQVKYCLKVALKIVQVKYCLKVVLNTGIPIYHKYTSVYIIYFFFVVCNELKKIGNLEFFVFVLSSHGEEKEEQLLHEGKQKTFQHYFFTKDGQCSTQDLMNKIANIEKLEGKLKIFVIQVN